MVKRTCLACGHPELLALITLHRAVALNGRKDTIKFAGVKLGQMDLKFAWDTIGGRQDSPEQFIRGPIVCAECEAPHFYIVGDKNPLRLGDVHEARALGLDGLRT